MNIVTPSGTTALRRSAPAVTVIMTHFGCERYLARAVRSVMEQSFGDFELWLADDHSPSSVWLDLVAPFRGDHRLRLFQADCNVGTYRLKARMIDDIRSPYVAFHDSDDMSESTRLEEQVHAINRRRLDVIGSAFRIVDENDVVTGTRQLPRSCNWLERLGKRHLVHHPTCMVRRRVFDEIGSFDATTRIGADSDFILRAARRFRIGNVRRPLYIYRERPQSLTGASDTGYGSRARQDYTDALIARWKLNRRLGKAADLSAPASDIPFNLREL